MKIYDYYSFLMPKDFKDLELCYDGLVVKLSSFAKLPEEIRPVRIEEFMGEGYYLGPDYH